MLLTGMLWYCSTAVFLHYFMLSDHHCSWLTGLHYWECLSVCVSIYSVCLYSVSNSRLEFVHVSLMHTVMPDQLIWAGELLLTAGPAARKRLLAWERQERKYRNTLYWCARMESVHMKPIDQMFFEKFKKRRTHLFYLYESECGS